LSTFGGSNARWPSSRKPKKKAEEALGSAVAVRDVPPAIEHHRGVGFLLLQDRSERAAHGGELGCIEIGFGEHRCKPRGEQQCVA
jgi:hypothetical protein